MSALPPFSDVDLLGYGKRIVDLNSEIADCTLDSSVAQQELKRVVLENNLLSLFVILEQHRSYTQFRSLVLYPLSYRRWTFARYQQRFGAGATAE